jgi:hypothetical protein
MLHRFVLPPIPPEQRTPLVDALLGIIEITQPLLREQLRESYSSRESSGYGKLVRRLIRLASACRGLMIKL